MFSVTGLYNNFLDLDFSDYPPFKSLKEGDTYVNTFVIASLDTDTCMYWLSNYKEFTDWLKPSNYMITNVLLCSEKEKKFSIFKNLDVLNILVN